MRRLRENLFQRAVALNQPTWEESREVLGWYASINRVPNKPVYSKADRERIVELLKNLGLEKQDAGAVGPLRAVRGRCALRVVERRPERVLLDSTAGIGDGALDRPVGRRLLQRPNRGSCGGGAPWRR